MIPFRICRTCGKRGFYSERAAKIANSAGRFRLRAYVCKGTGLWHVSNAEKR